MIHNIIMRVADKYEPGRFEHIFQKIERDVLFKGKTIRESIVELMSNTIRLLMSERENTYDSEMQVIEDIMNELGFSNDKKHEVHMEAVKNVFEWYRW